jgi:hypothetical protein
MERKAPADVERFFVSRSLESRRRAVADALRAVALEARLDALARESAHVQERLASVETALLESAWEGPVTAVTAATVTRPEPEPEPDPDPDERVSVPAVPLGEVRMSSAASRALFGG